VIAAAGKIAIEGGAGHVADGLEGHVLDLADGDATRRIRASAVLIICVFTAGKHGQLGNLATTRP